MFAFPFIRVFGRHHVIQMPPLQPRKVTSLSYPSGDIAPPWHDFDKETKFVEFDISFSDQSVDEPRLQIIFGEFASGLTMRFRAGVWTRFVNAPTMYMKYLDGGWVHIEIREY